MMKQICDLKSFIQTLKTKYLMLSVMVLVFIFLTVLLIVIITSVNTNYKSDQGIFSYTVKTRDAFEELDMVFERAEVNVNLMRDSIAYSYDTNKQKSKTYNMQYVRSIDGLIKSVLSNSPGVDGAWFQLNSDLPFAVNAYNWYEFKDNQFVNLRDYFTMDTSSSDREVNPEEDPYYFEAIVNHKTTWSNVYKDADTNSEMLTVSTPIYNNSVLIGVGGIDISMDNLKKILEKMQEIMGKSDIYLVDKKDNVILTQLISDLDSSKNEYAYLHLFEDKNQGPIEYLDGFTKKTAIRLLLSNDYKIVIVFNNRTLFSGTNNLINLIWALYLLLITVVSLVFVYQIKLTQVEVNTKSKSTKDAKTESIKTEQVEQGEVSEDFENSDADEVASEEKEVKQDEWWNK